MKTLINGRTGHPQMDELKKQIYAHRGFHDKPMIPENSMPAFRRAVDRDWGIELDVHLTKDGQLVIFHDSDLRRITGEEGILEERTWEELSRLKLEGTEERMPLFDEVLELCENRIPMIIELKTKGNRKELAKEVCDRLKTYRGRYCIESFDPLAMYYVRKFNDEIVRGQLSENFLKDGVDEKLPFYQKYLLTNLWLNVFSKPDFIAYCYEDRKNKSLMKAINKGISFVSWTIREKSDFDDCINDRIIPIFERFDPEI